MLARFATLAFRVLVLSAAGSPSAAAQGTTPEGSATLAELRSLLDDGRYAEAETRAGAEMSRRQGQDSIEGALLESWLAEAMRRNGKQGQSETVAHAEHAVQRAQELAGAGDARTGECWFQLGALRYTREEFAEARAALERALAIREAALGPGDPAVAVTLIFLGSLAWDAERDEKRAFGLFEGAHTIQSAALAETHPDVAWRLEREAIVFWQLGQLREARPRLEQALSIRARALRADHPLIGVTLYNLGGVARSERDWIAARDYQERALAVRRSGLGSDHPNVVWCLSELGDIASVLGDDEAARRYYEEALAIQRRNQRADGRTALVELDLARTELVSSRTEGLRSSRELAEGAISILRTLDSPLQLVAALTLRAEIAAAAGDLASVSADLTEARALAEGIELCDGAVYPGLLRSEAFLAARQGDLATARERLEESLRVQESLLGPRHADLEEGLYWYACLLLQSGEPAAAARVALRAEDLFREEWRRTAPGFEEDLLLSMDERSSRSLALALHAAARAGDPELVELVWAALLAARAPGFEEVATRRKLVRCSDDAAVQQKAVTFAGAERRLSRLFLRGALAHPGDLSGEELARARQARAAAERDLALATLGLRSAPESLDPDRVRQALPEKSALLSFACVPGEVQSGSPIAPGLETTLAGGFELIAFVQTRDEEVPRIHWFRDGARIAELARRLEELAREEGSEAEYRLAGGELFRLLWQPIAPELERIERVFVVPAGPVHFVDFDALPVGEHEYLVEHGPVFHYLSSERELLEGGSEHEAGAGLLAVGGADFGGREGAAQEDLLFAELPSSRSEIARVAELFAAAAPDEPITLLGERAALESAFDTLAPGRRMLHIATHGFSLDLSSTRTLAMRGIGATAPSSARRGERSAPRDVLLACGLAFTGANVGPHEQGDSDDGILSAEEIGTLDLTGVEWAVLSSCESARGVLRSSASREGLLGLRRAFRLAGVRTVIASLWPVDDRTAGEWMEELYRARLEEGRDAPSAVRAASLTLLERRRRAGTSTHPGVWGGFLSSGDWH